PYARRGRARQASRAPVLAPPPLTAAGLQCYAADSGQSPVNEWGLMRRLTIERTMLVILFALLLALAARVPVDTDTWWHIHSGEYILQNGIIYTDPFSHT